MEPMDVSTRSPKPDRSLPESARALAADLARELAGPVRFDRQARAAYATDASNYRRPPVGVVLPRDAAEVEAALLVCRRHGAAVLPRGAGTSLAGQAVNSAVVLDLSRHLHRVLDTDPERRLTRVEPGVVLDRLQAAVRPHGLCFGPDPSTHASCTLGGMLGNNACGVHSLTAGRTADNVESLTVLTADGERLTLEALQPEELDRRIAAGGREGGLLARLRELGEGVATRVVERFPDIPRRVSGFNLDEILPFAVAGRPFHPARALVGTEGTCAVVVEATVRLVPRPPERSLLLLGYPTLVEAASAVPVVLEVGRELAREEGRETLIGLEGLDRHLIDNPHVRRRLPDALELFPAGGGFLLAELGGFEPGQAKAAGRRLAERLETGRHGRPSALRLLTGPDPQSLAWRVREAGLGTTSRHPVLGDTAPGWEDAAVAPERLGAYVADLQTLLDRFGLPAALYGHFGDGCLHARIGFDFATRDGIARFRAFVQEAADLVVEHGGSLSGEHGDGQARSELLPRMFGPELIQAFRDFKTIWDPAGRMNPGNVVDPRPLDADLAPALRGRPHPRPLSQRERGAPSHPPGEETRTGSSEEVADGNGGERSQEDEEIRGDLWKGFFAYPDDDGSFARAVGRCVGVGRCRREEGGIMCPSYRVTRAEEHSTRGRARLLGEMLTGDVLGKRRPAREVKEALDLCLACKGCKSDCPVSVDMASYKAEFLARWYRFRPRPRSAHTLGRISRWARLASRVPRLANAVTASPLGARLLRSLTGIAPDRRLPRFADETFRRGFARRPLPIDPHPTSIRAVRRVLLWPDTFTNHFEPGPAHAAVEVLEAAGFEVAIPRRPLCCGRPLYDYGLLRAARRQLRRVLDTLHPEIAAGVPVVGLEPSCVATFQDEMTALFPGDPAARDLSGQVFLLGEFLEREAPDFRPGSPSAPEMGTRALLHGHCHQKSVLGGMETDRRWLGRLGYEVDEPEPGCCGMAGAFGFERGHAEVARACGELALLPAVREIGPDVLLVADGFSCRQQIRQETGRQARHLAEVLAGALAEGRDDRRGSGDVR
jgi:FAD/FMN-containing dehydrogenase/Fe-S oxidoreductase